MLLLRLLLLGEHRVLGLIRLIVNVAVCPCRAIVDELLDEVLVAAPVIGALDLVQLLLHRHLVLIGRLAGGVDLGIGGAGTREVEPRGIDLLDLVE